jgi:hypothetical protein
MSLVLEMKRGVFEVGRALRRPEELAVRWRDREEERDAPTRVIFFVLFLAAVLGLAGYGLTMGMHKDALQMLISAAKAPLAAGTAWAVALPALYVVNSATGSKLDASTTVLAALTTCSFGALAMLAGVPVNWFFTIALPYTATRWAVNILVFTGVGIAMIDVFVRVMRALEPDRDRAAAYLWLGLVGVIGCELMILLDLFKL